MQWHNHCLFFIRQLPVSVEDIVDLLNDVNQQLGENGEEMDEEEEKEKEKELGRKGPTHSSPANPTETSGISHVKFSTPSPNKSILSPSKRLVGSTLSYIGTNILYYFIFISYSYISVTLVIFFPAYFTDLSQDSTSLDREPE